jgi:hypothetical protein
MGQTKLTTSVSPDNSHSINCSIFFDYPIAEAVVSIWPELLHNKRKKKDSNDRLTDMARLYPSHCRFPFWKLRARTSVETASYRGFSP